MVWVAINTIKIFYIPSWFDVVYSLRFGQFYFHDFMVTSWLKISQSCFKAILEQDIARQSGTTWKTSFLKCFGRFFLFIIAKTNLLTNFDVITHYCTSGQFKKMSHSIPPSTLLASEQCCETIWRLTIMKIVHQNRIRGLDKTYVEILTLYWFLIKPLIFATNPIFFTNFRKISKRKNIS